jgi:hypothetical protein
MKLKKANNVLSAYVNALKVVQTPGKWFNYTIADIEKEYTTQISDK